MKKLTLIVTLLMLPLVSVMAQPMDEDFDDEYAIPPEILAAPNDVQLLWAANNNDLTFARQAVANGADLNIRSIEGYTPLMMAVFAQNEGMVEYLVETGANVLITNYAGDTAYLLANRMCYFNIGTFLLHMEGIARAQAEAGAHEAARQAQAAARQLTILTATFSYWSI